MISTSTTVEDRPIALITGGTGGIGQAIAHHLNTYDFHVVIASRHSMADDAVAQTTSQWPIVMDVTDPLQVEQGFRQVTDQFGRLDVLINGAGGTNFKPIVRMDSADWDAQFAVHTRGSFLCSQQALKLMKRRKSGLIIHISSLAAQMPKPGYAAYGAAKAALVNFSHHLNAEVGRHGIRSTVLCPSYVDTPLLGEHSLDPKTLIPPTVVAEAIGFLWQLPAHILLPELTFNTVTSPVTS